MKAAWLAGALIGAAQMALAGVIRLESAVLFHAGAETGSVCVVLRNSGDDDARQVEVQAALGGLVSQAPSLELPPGGTDEIQLDFPASALAAGRHVIDVRIRYRDRNGYPYSALTVGTALIGDQARDPASLLPVAMQVEPVTLSGSARLTATLRLEDGQAPRRVRLRLVLPDEIDGQAPDRLIDLFPGRTVRVESELRDRHARPGSVYPFFLIASDASSGFVLETAVPGLLSVAHSEKTLIAWPEFAFAGALLLLVLAAVAGWRGRKRKPEPVEYRGHAGVWGVLGFLVLLVFFLFDHIPLRLLLLDTTTTGGDTPAHLYLASHLKETLFGHGQVVSWAGGWWGGFPMFRYYFPLPYMLMAGLSVLVPFNVAFKLVTVLGIFLLAPAAWLAGRLMRLPKPAPLLLAAALVPFLFVRTHSMWGANIASTMAGMIANSLGFPLMLLAVASAWRDAEDGRFRLLTVLAWTLTLMSHFFTSVMGGLTAALIPFLLIGRRPFGKTLLLLAGEAMLAALMTAWWWIPLIARRGFSMDFGTNWPVTLAETLPPFTAWLLLPLAGLAFWLAARRGVRSFWLLPWMGLAALFLFWEGSRLSPVFVNVRLWPFFYFAFLAVAACGAAFGLRDRRGSGFATAALILAAFGWAALGERDPAWAVRPGVKAAPPARSCAYWNYEGMERKPMGDSLRRLLEPLKGTPGRLAYELNEDNAVLGSVRVFEAVPYLIGKPVLEGGLVNSAPGSMFAYYIQSESSLTAAGFPEIVKPATFNPAAAALHFRLFNVSHFIARSPKVRDGFAALPGWTILREEGGWTLFEVPGDRRTVHVPRVQPVGLLTDTWKQTALDWMAGPDVPHQSYVFLKPGSREADTFPGPVISEEALKARLDKFSRGERVRKITGSSGFFFQTADPVTNERVEDGRIEFDTTAPGQPHLVASMYDPDWTSPNGTVYQATPNFLLIYPDSNHVVLTYSRSRWVWLGVSLAWAGWLLWLGLAWRRRPRLAPESWRAGLLKMLDASLGPAACRLAGLWREPDPVGADGSNRILVIRPGGMGDMILLLPVLRRLLEARPEALLEVVCERRNRAVLDLSGLPVTVLEADVRPFRTWWRLRRGGYGIVLDTEQFHHLSAILARVTGAPTRIGFKINPLRNPLYTHRVAYDMDGYEGEQFMRLLEPLGAAGPYRLEGTLQPAWTGVSEAVRAEADRMTEGRRRVVLHAGGTRLEKRWGADRFGELAADLLRDPSLAVGLAGGPGDREESDRVRRLAGPESGRLADWTGRLSLEETAWVISRSAVFVGCDSGLAHLAVALGVRTVVLFGPGDQRKWGLADGRHRVIRQARPCAPCALFGYQKACRDRSCLRDITAGQVAAAVRELMKGGD